MKAKIFTYFFTLLLLNTISLTASSQDIHFSQFFETPLLRNPALAGIFSGDFRAQTVYRNQWNSVTNPYQTVSINAEYKLPIGRGNDFITLGGQVLYDKAGAIALSTTYALPALNYHKSLSSERNMYLSLGMMGGWVQRSLDRSKMTTNSQYGPVGYSIGSADGETFNKTSYSYFDGSVGMSLNTQIGENSDNNIFIGLAYHHFNKAPKISFYGNPNYEMIPKWVASTGIKMNVNSYSYLTLHADYSIQGTFKEAIAGALYSWKLDDMDDPKYVLHAGAFIRWKDALIPVVKIEIKPLSISASYDANLSQLTAGSKGRGGFELALTYQKYVNRNNRMEATLCPKF